MKRTAPHVQVILNALLALKPITDDEVNAILRDGKQSDLELAAIMASRTPYGPVLFRAAMSAYKEVNCAHVAVQTEDFGPICMKCSMRLGVIEGAPAWE